MTKNEMIARREVLGFRLRELRRDANMDLVRASLAANVPASGAHNVELGKTAYRIDTLIAYASSLGMELAFVPMAEHLAERRVSIEAQDLRKGETFCFRRSKSPDPLRCIAAIPHGPRGVQIAYENPRTGYASTRIVKIHTLIYHYPNLKTK